MKTKGHLYLIPCLLGDVAPMMVLPLAISEAIESIDYYVVEHEKTARRFIKSVVPHKSQDSLNLQSINKYTQPETIPDLLSPCHEGHDLGVISDAGCPGVADPGAALVAEAHKQNIKVFPLVGPSSILLALMGSGFNGQNFAFHGYLPIDQNERKLELQRLERESLRQGQAQIFIETPYRNNQMLGALKQILSEHTMVCVACDLTLPTQYIQSATIQHWQKISIDLHKRLAIFIIQA